MDYEAVNMATQFTSKIPGPGKKKSFLPAPVKTSSAPLPTKSPSPEPKDPFAIGDRVCIAGIKFGTLQYFGETHIAPGLWCGVELDEPEGNHDGMVQGRRYFTCEYKHGIFAPLDKVALLEEDIYFEDDYMDTGSELEEPVIARPKKSKHHSSESKIARSRSSHDADYSKSKIGRGSGIPKPGSKQRPLSYHSSSESLTQTSPIKTRSLKSVIKSQNSLEEDETNVPHPSKPSQIPGISRLPKYSQSSGSLVRSPSSSEHIVADITSPQSGESIISAEFIDDESYEIESENNSPRHQSPKRQASLGQSPEETYSNHVSVQLKSDSRHYLNLTFDPNEGGYVKSNLPDVVASTSPSPDNKEFGRDTYRDNVDGHGNVTLESCGSETLDSSRLDDINLLDSICDSKSDKKKRESLSVLSEQFDKLKLNNSPLTSKGNNSSATQDVSSSLKLSRDQFVNMEGDLVSDQMTCSNSQTLQQEVAPTMMKSLDDSSRKIMMDSGISEMSASQLTDSMTRSHQMDNIHGVLTKSTDMGKSVPISDQIVMTDSGIAGSYHRDANVGFVSNDVKLSEDLLAGHNKHERPVSLISTTSADTGYVPDTDSECGTKTTNSPGEWPAERLGDQTSMTESQIIQYQDSFQASCISEEVKHIINAQISVDSDVSGTTHDTETDRESEVSETHITETLKLDPAQESRSLSSHNSEDDRIEADQISSDIDDNLGDKGLENNHDNHQHEQPSPGSENSGDVVSVVDNTEVLETATEEGGVSNDGKTPNNKTTSSKASPKHAVKTEHKKPNTKVSSRLADYINTPAPPPKPKEETPNKKNLMNKKNIDKTNEKNVANIQKTESCRKPKIEKEPPKIIKRSPPKSKWGSIMSQIESHKDDKPVKVKTEVKSKLQEYLSNPAPAPVRKEKTPKKESKPRSVITNSPKPDYSKVKSRLSVIAPPPKRDNSPSSRRGSKVEKGNLPTPGSAGSSKTDISLEVNANRTPRTSISTTISKLAAESRRSSVSSVRSDKSQGSTKAVNSKLSSRKNSTTESKIAAPRPPNKKLVKSSIPPAIRTPKKVLPTVNERSSKKDNSRSVSLTKTPKKASNQNRNRALNSTPTRSSGYGKSSSSQQPDIVSNSIKSNRSQEVTRLESLCETRTKELNLVKIELKSTEKALDALACLIRYLTEELDAFSCPKVKTDLAQAQELQKQAQEQIAELQKVKRDLEEKLSEITKQQEESLAEITKLKSDMVAATEAHETAVKELKEQHEKKLKEETEKLEKNHTASTAKMRDSHEKMHHFMKVQSERELSDQKFESQSREDMLKVKHLEDIQELRNKHDRQMEELHRQHRNKLDDINKSFEYIKCTLGEKVECLRGECEELKYRAKQSEDALLRDTDVRVQMALAPYKHLPEEVDSLKAVVEMRNEEILKLRKQKMDLEKQLDELPIAREKIISLQQKIENLDAIVNLKSGHEKQLHDKVQILMSKYAKESKANKRLSMDYEELMYKMAASPEIMTTSQESLFKRQISRSPPGSECSSPDLRRKAKSPFDNGNGDQPSPRRSRKSNGDRKSQTDESLERKLNRRSQTFVLEKKSSTSTSPHHLSPSKIPNGSPMSTSLESEGSQVPVDIPPSDATDLDLSVSVSLNELGVAALEDSMVSNNSDSAAYISDSEVFDSPMKQKQNGDDEVVGKLELETDV